MISSRNYICFAKGAHRHSRAGTTMNIDSHPTNPMWAIVSVGEVMCTVYKADLEDAIKNVCHVGLENGEYD